MVSFARDNWVKDKITPIPMNEIFLRPVEGLSLLVRTFHGLRSADIKCVGELVQCTEQELRDIKNFGRKSLNEIKADADLALSLGMRLDN